MKGEKVVAHLKGRAWAMTQALSAYTGAFTTTAGSCYPREGRTRVLSDADVYNVASFGGKLYAFRVGHSEFHPIGDPREPSYKNGGPQMFRHCRSVLVCSFHDRKGGSKVVMCDEELFERAIYVVQDGELLLSDGVKPSFREVLTLPQESSFESLQRLRTGAIARIIGQEKLFSLLSRLSSSPSALSTELERIGSKPYISLEDQEKDLYKVAHLVPYVGIFAGDKRSIDRLRSFLLSYDREVGAFRS